MTDQITEEQYQRIEAGLENPPKPDFISQEEWDTLLASRQPDLIRAWGTMQAENVIAGEKGSDEIAGAPVIVVTVIGRKSGREIPVALNFVERNGAWYICGSFFGLQTPPLWVKNLDANPRAWVNVLDKRTEVIASRPVGEERAEIWEIMVQEFPLWGYFQKFCRSREFDIFKLTPIES